MLQNSRYYAVGAVIMLISMVLGLYHTVPSVRAQAHVWLCDEMSSSLRVLDCLDAYTARSITDGDVESALEEFAYMREHVPVLAAECHAYAHRAGDYWYYRIRHDGTPLSDLIIPRNASLCEAGFLHGFLVRISQNRPEPSYLVDVCSALVRNAALTVPKLATECMRHMGTGLLLSEADRMPGSSTVALLTKRPLTLCDAVPAGHERERDMCREGVFQGVLDWVFAGLYGLEPSTDAPFGLCNNVRAEYRNACAVTVARELPRFGIKGAEAVSRALSTIPNVSVREFVSHHIPAAVVNW